MSRIQDLFYIKHVSAPYNDVLELLLPYPHPPPFSFCVFYENALCVNISRERKKCTHCFRLTIYVFYLFSYFCINMWNTFGMIWVIYGIKILEIYFPTSVCAIVDSKPIKCLLAGATDPVRTSSLFRPNIEILDSWNAPMSLFILYFYLVPSLVPSSWFANPSFNFGPIRWNISLRKHAYVLYCNISRL